MGRLRAMDPGVTDLSDTQAQPTPGDVGWQEPLENLLDNAVPAGAGARVITFKRAGLYAIDVSRVPMPPRALSDGAVPLIWVASVPSGNGPGPEIVGNGGHAERWLGEAGGAIAVHAGPGGRLMGVVFGPAGEPGPPPDMVVQPLDAIGAGEAFSSVLARHSPQGPRRIAMQVLAHIERIGDVLYGEGGRIGLPNQGRRIEGFAIEPLEEIQPHHIQYRAIHRGGIEGPWTAGPNFCGTRGRGEPLCGFAVRLAPHLQGRFSVTYCAGFSDSGIARPCTNGEACGIANGEYLVSMIIEIFDHQNPSAADARFGAGHR